MVGMIVVIFSEELFFFELITSGELISKVEGVLPRLELSFCYALTYELFV